MTDRQTGYPSIDKPWLKYYSEEAIEAQVPQITMYDYMKKCNQGHLNEVALVYYENKIRYSELLHNIERTALAFHAIGICSNDIVTICLPNIPESVYILYALDAIGAVSNWIDPRFGIEEIAENLTKVESKVLVILDDFYPKLSVSVKTLLVLITLWIIVRSLE